jgi:hypothetical protein
MVIALADGGFLDLGRLPLGIARSFLRVAIVPPSCIGTPNVKVALAPPLKPLYTEGSQKESKVMSRLSHRESIGVKIRLAPSLLAKLEAAAKAKKEGQSTNAEIAQRLGKSFAEEEAFGGPEGRQMLYFLATAFMAAGERAAGNRKISQWIKDPECYIAGAFAVLEALLIYLPRNVPLETIKSHADSMARRVITQRLGRGVAS